HHPSGSFPIETVDRHKVFRYALLSQSDQKRFMEEPSRGNRRQKMRFISYQDMLILIEQLLQKGNSFFIFQLAVIKNAGTNSKTSLGIYAAPGFIHYLTLLHPRIPSFGFHMRILFFEKVHDSFPWTCRKPLAARTNSFDHRERRVQIDLVN